jgi:hypothetical protein
LTVTMISGPKITLWSSGSNMLVTRFLGKTGRHRPMKPETENNFEILIISELFLWNEYAFINYT